MYTEEGHGSRECDPKGRLWLSSRCKHLLSSRHDSMTEKGNGHAFCCDRSYRRLRVCSRKVPMCKSLALDQSGRMSDKRICNPFCMVKPADPMIQSSKRLSH